MTPLPLYRQLLLPALPATKIRLALLGTALADALGGPAEFQPRFGFEFVKEMQRNENFDLPEGVWTDDTSMALALGRAVARAPFESGQGEEDAAEAAQLEQYYLWWRDGELSAIGRCFDVGGTIRRALAVYEAELAAVGIEAQRWPPPPSSSSAQLEKLKTKRRQAASKALKRIKKDMAGAVFGGNGSLMRVVPVGLAYWCKGERVVGECARRSSRVTHPNEVCQEACEVWAVGVRGVVWGAAQAEMGMGKGTMKTKLDVLHHFASFSYKTDALKKALAADVPLPKGLEGDEAKMEAHYAKHHRLLRLITDTRAKTPASSSPALAAGQSLEETATLMLLPQAATLPSSGYVVHTLCAALYAFLATETFEAGTLLAVNMGDDADTVAAVYGGLAGAWYGVEEKRAGEAGEGEGLFWSKRVREWRDKLVRRELVEEVAEEVVEFAERSMRAGMAV
ncbi:ADP-ribosylation/Crystallin J1 [Favolaschia claudopus]|uniref:ADP-ribosylhydrolase ARH3 n=1 Tax=Favolaschia claudopus TaxID=2862362 RepID=A0AAW0D0Z8_9AGAR